MSEEKAIDAKEKVGVNPEMIIQEYIEKSVDHFQGELIRVEVEYEPSQAANAILYDFAGENIRVRKLENGRCRAVFQKMDSVTLVGWFMQHAGMYKVIGPEKLRAEVQDVLNRALNIYSK